MAGEVQSNTNPIEVQARFIKKSEAKKLDKIREEYVSLMEKAEKLEAKGKTEKADKKIEAAQETAASYEARAQELGLSITNVEVASAGAHPDNGESIVPEGTKLTKAERKEVEKLEKELKKAKNKLGKFTKEEIFKANEANSSGATENMTNDMKKILYYQEKVFNLQAEYDAKCKELGIPSSMDIINRIYEIEDPVKASKIRAIIKKELKDANMYFGNTKEALNEDSVDNLLDTLAIRNKINSNIEKGYVGTKKKLAERYKNEDAAQIAAEYAQAAGADLTFNRRSNERAISQLAQNVEYFNEPFIEENKDEELTSLETLKIDGKEIETADILRVTTLAGAVITNSDDFSGLKLKDISSVETQDGKYSFSPIYKERSDEGYLKRKNVKRLGKDMGFKYDKIKVGKALVGTAIGALPAGLTAALNGLHIAFGLHFKGGVDLTDIDGTISSSLINDLYNQFLEKAEEYGGNVELSDLDDLVAVEYIMEFYEQRDHRCVAPAAASAAAAFIGNILYQAYKKEDIAPEKAYQAAMDKVLTLEDKHNASGGNGYIINQKELDKVMYDAMVIVNEIVKAPAQAEEPQTKPAAEPQAVKTATITTTNIDPIVTEAEDCLYQNKAGEHWDGIVRLGYVDQKGNAITNEKDIAEIRTFIKRTVNGFAASSADMPNGVKVKKTYTCKSGNTYTWAICGEEPDAKLRDKYTSKEIARDINGNPTTSRRVAAKVGMESTISTVTPGEYSWSWKDNNDETLFGGMTYSDIELRDAAVEAERKALEKAGYTVK